MCGYCVFGKDHILECKLAVLVVVGMFVFVLTCAVQAASAPLKAVVMTLTNKLTLLL